MVHQEEQCHTSYEEVCEPSDGVCLEVMEQDCYNEDVEVCLNVLDTKCNTRDKEVCLDIKEMDCHVEQDNIDQTQCKQSTAM